tara:strand:- start:5537 stop:5866 length:330 start_codon:yes stop_codon:yes gene_type:complete
MEEQQFECDCQKKELQQVKNDLHKCRTSGQAKDKKIQKLDKKVFILTAVCIGIGAIAGKEALDSIAEWLGTIGEIKTGVDNLRTMLFIPSPGALALFPIALLCNRRRRR